MKQRIMALAALLFLGADVLLTQAQTSAPTAPTQPDFVVLCSRTKVYTEPNDDAAVTIVTLRTF